MIKNFLCEKCSKEPICRNALLISRFHEDAKKPLGIKITMDGCSHYDDDTPAEA